MAASAKIIVDPIHGDIHLSELERKIVDTPSFQRLRHLKQLGFGHLVYPNATHTRFAHSLGTLAIMSRVVNAAKKPCKLDKDEQKDLRVAALLHDIGHYPYSHLMESVDLVRLPEEFVRKSGPKRELDKSFPPYPNHEQVGRIIVNSQKDLLNLLGGKGEASKIADLFTRSKAADQQKSKFIHSSLDMDRMDYLLRDARATGVPYGQVDMNYLLNRLQVDKSGLIGVSAKAVPAAEHFLFARYFMYRVVYYHKTTLGFEEVCRHLLRRLRDKSEAGVPADGNAIQKIASTRHLLQFTDSMLDRIIHDATASKDPVIQALASTLSSRHPPQLLKEVQWFSDGRQEIAPPALFERNCKEKLLSLSKKYHIRLGQFIFVETKPLKIEQRGAEILASRANELPPDNEDELIRVMDGNVAKPLVETESSIIRHSSHTIFRMSRLYVVYPGGDNSHEVEKLKRAVKDWDKQ